MARKKPRAQGRKKDVPNLVRKDGYIINQFGVRIPEEQAKKLQNVVHRVNRKRDKQLQAVANQPMDGTRPAELTRDVLRLMGQEADMVILKRSASLHQFTSKRAFNNYLAHLEKVAATDYLDVRTRQYKRNLTKAIKEQYAEFPELTKGLIMKIRTMKPEQFRDVVNNNVAFEIRNQYKKSRYEQIEQLRDMRESLGMVRDDVYDEDITDDYMENY